MTEVEAIFSADGTPTPRKILWDAEWLLVESVGRAWTSDAGRHVLTRVSDGRVFELTYDGVSWHARIVSAPPRFA